MPTIIDTGILLQYIRAIYRQERNTLTDYVQSLDGITAISVVTRGEIIALALRNNWGKKRLKLTDRIVSDILVIDINTETIVRRYAEIDAYSQGRLPGKPLAGSARNMGKNDLWIAATASVLDARLLTLDQDFTHLHESFVQLDVLKA